MELSKILGPLNEKINEALNLINHLRQESIKRFNIDEFKPNQINFEINRVLQNDDIASFIKIYKKLYEDNSNKFQKFFIPHNFISNHFMKLLDNLLKSLMDFLNENKSMQYELFQEGERGLNQQQSSELKNIIKEDVKNYKEETKKFFKKYTWRGVELLDIIIIYLKTLDLAMKNISILFKEIPEGMKNFRNTQILFQDQNTIKKGKYEITSSYRSFLILLDQINELFSKVVLREEERKGNPINNLYDIINNLKEKYIDIYQKINEKRESFGIKKIILNFNLDLKQMETTNDVCGKLGEKIIEVFEKFQMEYEEIKNRENQQRIDIAIILDITSSMENYIDKFKEQFYPMIDSIIKECPDSLVFVGFIGYKDLEDKKLGDDYINIDFSINYDKLKEIINQIEPDGGDDIPEDVAGAFELSLKMNWKGNTKIAFLITDSPCHGSKYHDLNKNLKEEIDKYDDENPNGKKIDEIIQDLFTKNISLFCLNLHKNTHRMFEYFKDKFESMRLHQGKHIFSIENENFFNNSIVEKIKNLAK